MPSTDNVFETITTKKNNSNDGLNDMLTPRYEKILSAIIDSFTMYLRVWMLLGLKDQNNIPLYETDIRMWDKMYTLCDDLYKKYTNIITPFLVMNKIAVENNLSKVEIHASLHDNTTQDATGTPPSASLEKKASTGSHRQERTRCMPAGISLACPGNKQEKPGKNPPQKNGAFVLS